MEKIFNFTKKKKFQYNAVLSFKYQVKDGSYWRTISGGVQELYFGFVDKEKLRLLIC